MEKPKQKKHRSSMKSIQEAIVSFIPVAKMCIHQTRTHSSRDFYPTASFDSIYYTPPSPSHSSATITSSPFSPVHCHSPILPTRPSRLPDEEYGTSSTSSDGRNHEEHPTSSDGRNHEEHPTSVLPVYSCVSSRRFFFSPRTTKSIMEERKLHLGHRKVRSLDDPPGRNPPRPITGACYDDGGHCFCEDSVHMVMRSEEPYRDFRVSMKEMVDAHGLRDWSRLQKLLHCYLRLNDKKTHPIIMLAFIDLLVHFQNDSNPRLSYSSPLLL